MRQNLRILIADDDADILEYLRDLLETKLHHKVVGAARDGKQALQMALKLDPDLIITDIKMPEMSGLELAEKVCERKPTPFVVLTGLTDAETIERATRGSVYSYLIKPLDERYLLPAIEVALNKNEQFLNLKKQFDDQKKIQRAKGIIMAKKCLSEPDAHAYLQRLAQDARVHVRDIADSIILMETVERKL